MNPRRTPGPRKTICVCGDGEEAKGYTCQHYGNEQLQACRNCRPSRDYTCWFVLPVCGPPCSILQDVPTVSPSLGFFVCYFRPGWTATHSVMAQAFLIPASNRIQRAIAIHSGCTEEERIRGSRPAIAKIK
jgi:hypothetical protein